MMDVCITLIAVMVSQVYAYIKTNQVSDFKCAVCLLTREIKSKKAHKQTKGPPSSPKLLNAKLGCTDANKQIKDPAAPFTRNLCVCLPSLQPLVQSQPYPSIISFNLPLCSIQHAGGCQNNLDKVHLQPY